ncbi:hypothetical protein FHR22_003425 [Sphingopyxis panaciterrae]|nr:hypothetical protein [Sphingopyxis panaciterrae]
MLDALAEAIDSTYIKAQRFGVWRKRGRQTQAVDRFPGGWTTRIHATTDVLGRPYVLMLTAGNVSDVKATSALLERAGPMRYLPGDNGLRRKLPAQILA